MTGDASPLLPPFVGFQQRNDVGHFPEPILDAGGGVNLGIWKGDQRDTCLHRHAYQATWCDMPLGREIDRLTGSILAFLNAHCEALNWTRGVIDPDRTHAERGETSIKQARREQIFIIGFFVGLPVAWDLASWQVSAEAGFSTFIWGGAMLLHNFEIFKEAGEQRAVEKVFHGLVPNLQGQIEVTFEPVVQYALVNALELTSEK